jgi:hypothetical protein
LSILEILWCRESILLMLIDIKGLHWEPQSSDSKLLENTRTVKELWDSIFLKETVRAAYNIAFSFVSSPRFHVHSWTRHTDTKIKSLKSCKQTVANCIILYWSSISVVIACTKVCAEFHVKLLNYSIISLLCVLQSVHWDYSLKALKIRIVHRFHLLHLVFCFLNSVEVSHANILG